jgi:hypothetical protein
MKPFMPTLLIVLAGLPGCSSGHPHLPEASKVKSIKIISDHGKSTSLVSPDHIPTLLALFQAGSKDGQPAKWQVLGDDLEITIEDGKQINIWLFKTFAGTGAFAIGQTWKDRVYYRGATDEQIVETVEKAKSAAKRGNRGQD